MTDKIMIGIPAYSRHIDVATAANIHSAGMPVSYHIEISSLLARCFNTLLCNAYNLREQHGFTHFCLMHADIEVTTDGWAVKMLDEMRHMELGALSAVVPIKQQDGATSTALDVTPEKDDVTILYMHDLFRMPETITGEDTKHLFGNEGLLINTGLMMLDMSKIDPTRQSFHIMDQIIRVDGKYYPRGCPEDWHISRMFRRDGIRYGATRKITVKHWGHHAYCSGKPYGRESIL